jgi:hypothetical protein
LSYFNDYISIGSTGSFGFYSSPKRVSELGAFKGGTAFGEDSTWAMTAGDSFGLTQSGQLYAASGKLGGWTIEEHCLSSGGLRLYDNSA